MLDANRKFQQAAGRYYDLSQLGNTTDIIDSLILMILSSSWEELPHVRFSLQVDLNVTEFLDWYIRMIVFRNWIPYLISQPIRRSCPKWTRLK